MIMNRSRRRRGQQGVTLMLTIFILLALTFAVVGLLYFIRYDNLVSANVAVRASAREASDQGLSAAATALQNLPGFPQLLTGPQLAAANAVWYDPNLATLPPGPGFWSSCAGVNCASMLVTAGKTTFTVKYVVVPTPVTAQTLNGYQDVSNGATSYLIYDAYVDVTLYQPLLNLLDASNMHVDVEAVLRKVGS